MSFRSNVNVLQKEEDARELNFGDDFEKASCLNVSEVQILLDARKQMDEEDEDMMLIGLKNSNRQSLDQTRTYCARFSTFKNKEAVASVRQLLDRKENLVEFEKASLANLTPKEEGEAKYLVGSLDRIKGEELTALLDEMNVFQSQM
eukprot:CFRG2695T1